VTGNLKEIEAELNQAESRQRGYLLTGNKRYLESYSTGVEKINQTLKTLRRLTADNPNQQQRLTLLESLTADKLAKLQETINLRQQKGSEAARGQELTVAIHQIINEMEGEENALLRPRSQKTAAIAQEALLIASVGILPVLIILYLIYRYVNDQIYERLQVEETLEQERNFVSTILDTAGALVIVLNLQGEIIRFNRACEQLTGYSFAEVRGKFFWELLLIPEEREQVKAVFKNLQLDALPSQYENYWLTKQKDRRLISWSNNVLLDNQEMVEYIIGTGIDITERKQAEEKVQESERVLRQVIDSVPHFIFAKDQNGNFLLVNQAVAEAYGASIEQLIQKNTADFAPAIADLRRFQETDLQVIRSGQSQFVSEETITDAQGKVRILQTTKIPFQVAGSERPAVLVVSVDITERKAAEEAVQESEQRYRSVVDSVKEVIFQTDVTGVWTFLNPAWTKVTGFAVEESLGTSFLDYVHPGDRQHNLELFHPLIERQKEFCRHEIRYLTKQGGFRWVEAFARLILNTEGAVIGTSGTLIDITQRKQAEDEIRKMLAKEKELSDLKSRFITTTSHEFRTPLSVISSSAGLLEDYNHKLDEVKRRKHLHRIQASVQHMTHLLEDVLVINCAELGKLEFKPVPLDLGEFCRNLVEEMQLANTHQQIVFSPPETTPFANSQSLGDNAQKATVCMDPKLLRQIFSNLLSNAIKYSPPQSTIYFDLTYEDEAAIFQIQDQGIGIPPEDQEHLFEPFHRAKNVGNIPGTGLGLSIVRKCVELHKGRIITASEALVGTTFKVSLPLH
jgi:PAS domain S-box-containing protein